MRGEKRQQGQRVDHRPKDDPGPELSKPTTGVIDNHAHDRIGYRVNHADNEKQRSHKCRGHTGNIGVVVHEKEINDGAGEVFTQRAQPVTELGACRNRVNSIESITHSARLPNTRLSQASSCATLSRQPHR